MHSFKIQCTYFNAIYHLLHYIPQLKDAAGKYGAVQHCFPVYGGGLEVQGVDGILQVR